MFDVGACATGVLRLVFVGGLALGILGSTASCDRERGGAVEVRTTLGDLFSVHDAVFVDGRMVQGEVRLSDGQKVRTEKTGRARLRLDSGATLAVDGGSSLAFQEGRLRLHTGRVFVRAEESPLLVAWKNAQVKVSQSSVAFELSNDRSRAYCAQGEFTVELHGTQHRVQAGETATISGEEVRVLPEKAFEDWTGGLASPVVSEIPGKSAVPHGRVVRGDEDAGQPLIVRSHHVESKIVGEVAVTRATTVFFNGSDQTGDAIVRLALPEGAFVTEVTSRVGKDGATSSASVQVAAGPSRLFGTRTTGLEWAGGGWLEGSLAYLPAGETLTFSITFSEWLPVRDERVTYRYAMETDPDAPAVSELSLAIDSQETKTDFLTVSAGSKVVRRNVAYRAADVKPRGDFVVELLPDVIEKNKARVYVQRSGPQKKDAYIYVRTELPPKVRQGVTLAVVIDTSWSVGSGTLETSLAVVDALLQSLGEKDSIVLLAADETVRTIGPALPAPVTPALRTTLNKELSQLSSGGASNLALGLQRAADLVDQADRGEQGGQGMVLYIGDGAPTVGEPTADAIRQVLSSRPGGMPRIGAALVGPMPHRWLMARLVRASGSVVEVKDRAGAARAGSVLLSDALEPRYRDVTLDLGPHVDRIYPRHPQVVRAGGTVEVIGRLRGPVPKKMGLSYRDGSQVIRAKRSARRLAVPPEGNLERKWAQARVEEIAAQDQGIEPAIALAREAGLITPWTSFLFGPLAEGSATLPFRQRILELSTARDVAFARLVEGDLTATSSLIEPRSEEKPPSSLVDAAEAAMRRLLQGARRSLRACRDARAAVSPQVGDNFHISISINDRGFVTTISVRESAAPRRDLVLERCMEGVVKSLPFVPVGRAVSAEDEIVLHGRRSLERTTCSEASRVSLPVRRDIWRARRPSTAEDYRRAAESCELRRWAERQEFLLLMMENRSGGPTRLELARELTEAGEEDASEFIVQETLRRVRGFEELQSLLRILRENEPNIEKELELALSKVKSSEEGLAVCQTFLRLAPHSTYARLRLLALLEALGKKEQILSTVRGFRAESVVDAELLAEGASAVLRLGNKTEGRRIFGELIERAPNDPWTLAFVGDRLRAEGFFDDASAAYASLARMLPHEAGVVLRQALAHAGAGRVDMAARLLDRVSETGGRRDEGHLADLAAITEAVLLAAARGSKDAEQENELERRLLRTPLPDAAALVLVEAAPSSKPVRLSLLREEGETLYHTPDLDAAALGLLAARVERGEVGSVRLALEREAVVGPSHATRAMVSVLSLGGPGSLPVLTRREVSVRGDGKPIELTLSGGRIL